MLRSRGLLVTPAETIDAVAALAHIDVSDRRELHQALRIVLASRKEDYSVFDELFETVWTFRGIEEDTTARTDLQRTQLNFRLSLPSAQRAPARLPALQLDRWLKKSEGRGVGSGEEQVQLRMPSDREAQARKDFAAYGADDLDEIARVAHRIARRLAMRPSRRWRSAKRGRRVDIRRTIRRSLDSGGDAVRLALRERKVRKTKLVILCDVSGSMDLYSRFLLQFLYAMQNSFARVESFVFSTRLSRITDSVRGESYRSALASLTSDVCDWSGGTRIGSSLSTFIREWDELLDSRTIVLILSDGWETGDPEELAEAMREIRERAQKIIWLNPLLGSPDYKPLTGGMQAALPYVDVFAPAHNLASLESLACHLIPRSAFRVPHSAFDLTQHAPRSTQHAARSPQHDT